MGDHPGVPGILPEPADVRVFPVFVLAELCVAGIEFEHEPVCGVAQPPEGLRLRQLREVRIGLGDVLRGQVPGLVLDDLDRHRVDLARRERREGAGQPVRDRARVADLGGRGLQGQVELPRQLVGGEVAEAGPAAITGLYGRAAAGQLAHGRQLHPRGPRLHPPAPGQNPDQLVVGQPGQPGAVLADHGVQHRTQQRPGRHGVGLAVLGESGQGQLLGRQADEQALLRTLSVIVLPGGTAVPGRAGAIRLVVVRLGIGEAVPGARATLRSEEK